MLHLIQPRFRMIFGEHYYRTVIADLQRTPDSMVVHAYVLLDPDKDNLYHSYTVWFSSDGHVKFGRWILFPANVHVERSQLVPNRFYCTDTFLTIETMLPFQILEISLRSQLHGSHGILH